MTAPYQVFVDGPRDRSASAVTALATAMGARYGLAPAALEARLLRGRFKVKAGIDRATAEEYARDLERLGAVCTVVDANGAVVDLGRGVGAGQARATGLPARTSPLPARTSPLPARTSADRPVSKPLVSGLAAASAGAATDLGALGRDDAIALSSLDGEAEALIEPTSLAESSFGPSKTPVPASSFGPSKTPVPPAAPEAARAMTGPPVDLFAAPGGDAEMDLALDVEERPKPPPRAASQPVAVEAAVPAVAEARVRRAAPRWNELIANTRVRFAAGVLIAVLIGFVPAHVIAHVRERAAYADVDERLDQRQAAAQTMEEYDQLDKVRARALDRKYDERRDIASTALIIWAAVAAGIAYVWFRRVPWDRLSRA